MFVRNKKNKERKVLLNVVCSFISRSQLQDSHRSS